MPETPSHLRTLRNSFTLEEATSVLRHDLRNRLAAIRNATFYLQRRVQKGAEALWTSDARMAQMFELIEKEIGAAEIRMASPLSAPAPQSVDLGALVKGLAAALAGDSGVGLRLGDVSPMRVRVDPAEAELAVWLLIENGLQAGAVTVSGAVHDGHARVEVIDDGPGLSAEATTHALDPFFTTRPGRFGVGLNIARRIAGRARGALEVKAVEPNGVRAVFSLPVEPGPEPGAGGA
jgi:signal transduction histidine kinase